MRERIKKPAPFRDTSWETVKQLVSRDMDRLDYYIHLQNAKAIEDTESLIVVEVSGARDASVLARRYSPALRAADVCGTSTPVSVRSIVIADRVTLAML